MDPPLSDQYVINEYDECEAEDGEYVAMRRAGIPMSIRKKASLGSHESKEDPHKISQEEERQMMTEF